jgi:hypothetical protein
MAISVEELASRLNAEAAAERFAFAGKGHSGRGDLGERHKEIRDELITEQRDHSE